MVNVPVVIPYSDKLFKSVAIEWLIATDQMRHHLSFPFTAILSTVPQPIEAFDHPKFKEMIDVAS